MKYPTDIIPVCIIIIIPSIHRSNKRFQLNCNDIEAINSQLNFPNSIALLQQPSIEEKVSMRRTHVFLGPWITTGVWSWSSLGYLNLRSCQKIYRYSLFYDWKHPIQLLGRCGPVKVFSQRISDSPNQSLQCIEWRRCL